MNTLVDYFHQNHYPDLTVGEVADRLYSSPEVFDQAIAHVQQKHYPDIPPEKIKPLFVNNPNDPRLKAYNDSLNLYNWSVSKTKDMYNAKDFFSHLDNGDKKSTLRYSPFVDNVSDRPKSFWDLESINGYRPVPEKTFTKIYNPNLMYENGGKSDDNILQSQIYTKPVQPVIYQKPQTNFEKRIQNPAQTIENKDGTSSTHKMMSFEADGKYYAAPTIVQINGKLLELKPEEAIDYAMKNGEFKEFKTEKEAQQYAEGGYKKGTPLENFKKKDEPKKNVYLEKIVSEPILPIKKEPISKEVKDFYQGRQFMIETGLRPDYYTRAQIDTAMKNKNYRAQKTISRTLPKR
jgi:hypothetical protein